MAVPGPRQAFPVQPVIDPQSIHIGPLTRDHAQDIATWQYDAPYDVYDMVGTDPEELLQPEVGYPAVLAHHRLIVSLLRTGWPGVGVAIRRRCPRYWRGIASRTHGTGTGAVGHLCGARLRTRAVCASRVPSNRRLVQQARTADRQWRLSALSASVRSGQPATLDPSTRRAHPSRRSIVGSIPRSTPGPCRRSHAASRAARDPLHTAANRRAPATGSA